VQVLSADSMEGRKTGTEGSARARRYIEGEFKRLGLLPFGASYGQPFAFAGGRDSTTYHGTNIVGYLKGTAHPDKYIVLSAHYDHLGVIKGEIYHGADDNASGVAALLVLARQLGKERPESSIIFAAFDAEEFGVQGARAFVRVPPVERRAIVLDINLDMVSHNEHNELYAVGAYHYRFLRRYLEATATRAPVRLLIGHDRPGQRFEDDWTDQSDHFAFHEAKIPFIYFGVEDHKDYHKPTDTFATITPQFFVRAVETIGIAVRLIDRDILAIDADRGRAL
jgi:Zn-dependent M28 family amino/carboxypeptidase